MPYYVFAIGGTGARCLESLLYLCATGLGPAELHPILVDPDCGNGNLNRTKELIIRYKAIRDKINNPVSGSLFYTKLLFNENEQETDSDVRTQIPNFFDPNSDLDRGTNTLAHFIDYNNSLKGNDGQYLADLLFSSSELDMDMAQGYRGDPSIGSMLMSNIEKREMWDVLVSSLQNNPSSKVFIFASVFGGTGASGYPVISQLIKNKAPNARVGGALLLPYFRLPDPNILIQQNAALKNEILPNSNSFMVNSKAACDFYRDNFSDIDSNYILGDDIDNCEEYEKYAPGSNDQKNDAHMIELFAAYAALDFWGKKGDNYKGFYHIQVNNPQEGPKPSFNIRSQDIPKILQGKGRAYPFERFALFCHYLDELYELAQKQSSGLLDKITWLRKNSKRGKDVLAAKAELQVLKELCDSFRTWVKQNHSNKAPLTILDENLRLDTLLQDDPDRYRNKPISRLDNKLCRGPASGSNLTEILARAASKTEITREEVG